MIITINTKEDSKEEILAMIQFLKEWANHKPTDEKNYSDSDLFSYNSLSSKSSNSINISQSTPVIFQDYANIPQKVEEVPKQASSQSFSQTSSQSSSSSSKSLESSNELFGFIVNKGIEEANVSKHGKEKIIELDEPEKEIDSNAKLLPYDL